MDVDSNNHCVYRLNPWPLVMMVTRRIPETASNAVDEQVRAATSDDKTPEPQTNSCSPC